jgi:hypothetical protein
MTDERQEQKSPEEAGPGAAQPVGDRQDQAAEGRFSKEPVGGADEDAERHEGLPRPQGQTEAKTGEETVDEGKEDPHDTQEKVKAKFGEAQGKLGGRSLPAAVVGAVGMALLLLLLLRRRRG